MAGKLEGKKIAFLVAPEGVEQVELTDPWRAVESEGGAPELISTDAGDPLRQRWLRGHRFLARHPKAR